MKQTEVLFTRTNSVGGRIARILRSSRRSIDAALYRLSQPGLARALSQAVVRGVSVRVILDRKKFKLTPATQDLVARWNISYRLMSGPHGRYAKMHHKMAIVDGETALTGSYNWTDESEKSNFENLVIIRDSEQVKRFAREFEALWSRAGKSGTRPRSRRAPKVPSR